MNEVEKLMTLPELLDYVKKELGELTELFHKTSTLYESEDNNDGAEAMMYCSDIAKISFAGIINTINNMIRNNK